MNQSILDFFDPGSRYHLRQYKVLQKTGQWDPVFWEDIKNLYFPNLWQVALAAQIADYYIDIVLSDHFGSLG